VPSRGKSDTYQCGVPVNGVLVRPKPVTNLDDVCVSKVFAGHKHSAALLADGSIRSWGKNDVGQLGIGKRSDAVGVPTCVEQLKPGSRLTHAALGGNHSLLLDEDGAVWAAGSNEWGQLGLGTPLSSLGSEFQRPLRSRHPSLPETLNSMPVVMIKHEMDMRVREHAPCVLCRPCQLYLCSAWHPPV
jgi:alpha-tubulin suppressor-like RCC1 family protein